MTGYGHEPPSISAGAVILVGAAMAAVVILVLAISLAYTEAMAGSFVSPPPFPLESHEREDKPAPPRLEQIERLERRQPGIHADELRRSPEIDEYGWVDKNRGVARIPIERAMKLVIEEKGLPSKKETPR